MYNVLITTPLSGTTHEEAELFCKTVGNLHLCPVQAYCPNGAHAEKPLFLHKRLFQGEQWAPVSEYNNNDVDLGNNWVMVGNKYGDRSSCAQYETLNGDMSPPWTADGSQTELKQHILCCMKQSDLKEDMDAVKDFNPIWMDKSHGWNGGSYSDGEKFCEGLDKKLCPYSACEFYMKMSVLILIFFLLAQMVCFYILPSLFARLSTWTWHAPEWRPYLRFQ